MFCSHLLEKEPFFLSDYDAAQLTTNKNNYSRTALKFLHQCIKFFSIFLIIMHFSRQKLVSAQDNLFWCLFDSFKINI